MKWEYKSIKFDDVEIEGSCSWSQVCCDCVNKHNINKSILDETASSPICGIVGCENEADYYIDFPKEELKIHCTVCGKECFDDDGTYPQVVFSDEKYCVCEECSIDYEENNVTGKVQYRQDLLGQGCIEQFANSR
jgi:hypothetical protein